MRKLSLVFIILCSFFGFLFLESCKETPYAHGKILYENFCESCHMADGKGLQGVIPPLAGADYLEKYRLEIACIIRKGQKGEIVVNGQTYNQEMVGIPQLSDFEITNVINYINSAWGNDYGYTKITEVQEALETCPLYE
jgi:mono/diheme cytochrome c family protein